MGLFDRKNCDICGNKIGMLGNRKLEDGNLCKDCAAKLSPHFSERRHATVNEIRQQLLYREANKRDVAAFTTTRSWGSLSSMLRIDDNTGRFTVTTTRDMIEENPDILPLSDVTNAVLDISESRSEITHRGPDGRMIPDDPPRYSYRYDFYVRIYVNHPYFDDLRVRLNPSTVKVDEPAMTPPPGPMAVGRNAPGRPVVSRTVVNAAVRPRPFNPHEDPEYVRFAAMGDEVVDMLKNPVPQQTFVQQAAQNLMQNIARAIIRPSDEAAQDEAAQEPAPASAFKFCPNCGQKLDGPSRFCPNCGQKLGD